MPVRRPGPDRDLLDRSAAYADHASWAVWGAVSPEQPFDSTTHLALPTLSDELLAVLHVDVVMVGLNPGNARNSVPWGMFHRGGRSHDERIAEALRQTPLWGAYMTDLFPDVLESDSGLVVHLDDAAAATALQPFQHELAALGAVDPVLVCFGGKATRYAEGLGLRVVGIDHYSGANRNLNRARSLGMTTEAYYRQLVHHRLREAGLL